MAGKIVKGTLNEFLEELCGKTSTLNLGDCYLALASGTPVESGNTITGLTELSGNGYKRALAGAYGQTATYKFGTASGGIIANSQEILFESAKGGNWAQATYWCMYTAATGGTMRAYGQLVDPADDTTAKPITCLDGEVVYFAVGEITISID